MDEHFPYPRGAELDNLLEPRAPGLSYLWPLAVAGGIAPAGSKPSDIFQLMRTWDRDDDAEATQAMCALYDAATVWAWCDRMRERLANANAIALSDDGERKDTDTRYESWAGTEHAPPITANCGSPSEYHLLLWQEAGRREKLLAGKLEGLCGRAQSYRRQTLLATEEKTRRAENTEDFIRSMARQNRGSRQTVARLIEAALVQKKDDLAKKNEALAVKEKADFNYLSFASIRNTLSRLFPGDAWSQRL